MCRSASKGWWTCSALYQDDCWTWVSEALLPIRFSISPLSYQYRLSSSCSLCREVCYIMRRMCRSWFVRPHSPRSPRSASLHAVCRELRGTRSDNPPTVEFLAREEHFSCAVRSLSVSPRLPPLSSYTAKTQFYNVSGSLRNLSRISDKWSEEGCQPAMFLPKSWRFQISLTPLMGKRWVILVRILSMEFVVERFVC